MNAAVTEQLSPDDIIGIKDNIEEPKRESFAACGKNPMVLTDIYQEQINIAIWQRSITKTLSNAVSQFLQANEKFERSITLSPSSAYADLEELTKGTAPRALLENMAELVDMFCCLFDLKRAGLRLAILDTAMCPRFHVDRVPCRLVTTYHGLATEWLPNHLIDRAKLGHGSLGRPDSVSGLYSREANVQQLTAGDVALLKGERWEGNERTALVHRSPTLLSDEKRLFLSLDFSD
ncbi:DUF1826 domain-containing protein [Photobacterium rosenbergii]|uniref:DUF1826 domain-containing protein n=1 Tax=Photobacterium rosenbergii TaxID=294936 RepID=UPI001C9916AC|nr:DUF1826 domain-containing protein [Photobacterium rosenbergii]MBY5944532.1 DUF1826 domain-containing protein [Photobacterium rosenbergii]